MQAWTLPVLAALPLIWSRSRSDLLRSTWFQAFVCLTALALHWYIILMTGGRGVALSLLASFVICLLVFPATRRPSLRWHLPGLAFGVLLFFAVAHFIESSRVANTAQTVAAAPPTARQPESVNPEDHFAKPADQSRFKDQSIAGRWSLDGSGRTGMWRDSIRDIRMHPLLGIGPMNYACSGPVYRAGHPHNFALQFAGEWGLLATLVLLVILSYLARVTWKVVRHPFDSENSRHIRGVLASGVVAAVIYSLLSGVFVMPASQITGILVGGWLMGVAPVEIRAQKLHRIGVAVLIGATLLVSMAATFFSFAEAWQREYRDGMIDRMDQRIPRYFQQGKLCKYFDEF